MKTIFIRTIYMALMLACIIVAGAASAVLFGVFFFDELSVSIVLTHIAIGFLAVMVLCLAFQLVVWSAGRLVKMSP